MFRLGLISMRSRDKMVINSVEVCSRLGTIGLPIIDKPHDPSQQIVTSDRFVVYHYYNQEMGFVRNPGISKFMIVEVMGQQEKVLSVGESKIFVVMHKGDDSLKHIKFTGHLDKIGFYEFCCAPCEELEGLIEYASECYPFGSLFPPRQKINALVAASLQSLHSNKPTPRVSAFFFALVIYIVKLV